MRQSIRRDLGKRLKQIRRQLHLTQKAFGEKIGMVPTYISSLENARTGPGYYFLYQAAKYYNINPLYLILGKGPPFIDLEEKKKKEEKQEVQKKQEEKKPEPPASGNDNPQVKEMLSYFERSPMVKYTVLGFFTKFILENKNLIEEDMKRLEIAAAEDINP
jgi:transcriptional regulator with XRE-family HTH domain